MITWKSLRISVCGLFSTVLPLLANIDATKFDGAGQTPEVRDTPALNLAEALSLEAWIYPEAFPQPGVRIIDKSREGTQSGYMLDTFPGNSLRFLLAEGTLSAENVLKPDHWVHVVGVFSVSEGVFKLYVDGKQVADASRANMKPILVNHLPLRIGADSNGQRLFRGEMARVAIYSRALNADEVARLASAPDHESLHLEGRVADWDFRRPGLDAYVSIAAGALVLKHPVEIMGKLAAPPQRLSSLWYRQPAANWNEALPIGNGHLGAMVFGRIDEELLQLNDDTLWSGKPHSYAVEGAASHLDEVRRLLFEGKESEAAKLAGQYLMGNPVFQQAYQPLGDLSLVFHGHDKVSDYRRELNLNTGVARTRYRIGAATFTRSCFISKPDQVLVVRLEVDRPGMLNFEAGISSPLPSQVTLEGDRTLKLSGQWIGEGKDKPLIAAVEGSGLRFEGGLTADLEGGTLNFAEGQLRVRDATRATLCFAAATSFKNYHDISADPGPIWRERLKKAGEIRYKRLLARQEKDMRGLMGRVEVELGRSESVSEPTDIRLKAVRAGADDPQLCALYFQYGRYLLASSSRPGTQPANLQGIWNRDLSPAWGSKWTININTEMNYWPAEVCNLPECHLPLFDLLDDLSVTGAEVARKHYNCRGWVVHHNADLWRGAAPVDGVWGVWPMASAWLSLHPWEHYEFSGDREFLQKKGWPLMKGAARFILDFLVEAPAGTPVAGKLVTNPSHSPENSFKKPDGTQSSFTYAATMDLMIVHELLTNCVRAIDVMDQGKGNFEQPMRGEIVNALSRLAPLQISKRDGRLQEWVQDYDEPEPGHRHMSHLFGLHPGSEITVEGTPELAVAARKSLDFRLANGGGGTGWSRAWVVNFYARLQDGNEAYKNLKLLLARSTLPNMFDNHPPFQIDGNFGGTAGIAEMLLQSRHSENADKQPEYQIHLLPALAPTWTNGWYRGLRARGGFEVDVRWKDRKLEQAVIRSTRGGRISVRCDSDVVAYNMRPGGLLRLDKKLRKL
jgi:alpha-L-fucosidase 2